MAVTSVPLNRWHVLLAVLIAYGSLYPFDFTAPTQPLAALCGMVDDAALWSSRGDVLGNILLFLPWGLATGWPRPPRIAALLPSLLAGLALAVILQVTQLALPSRDAALSDVLWNGAGLLLGQFAIAPRMVPANGTGTRPAAPLPWVLIALWAATQTLPFVPSLDLALLRDHLRAFFTPHPFNPGVLAGTFGGVLALGHLARTVLPAHRVTVALALFLSALLAIRLIIAGGAPHWHETAAMAAGWAAVAALRDPRRLAPAAFAALIAGLTLDRLSPYNLSSPPGAFNWLPFSGYLQGNLFANLRELLDTVWVCATLLWLAHAMSARVAGVGVFLVAWVLALEVPQIWLPGRSADLTPAVIALLATLPTIRLLRGDPPPHIDPPAPLSHPAAPPTPDAPAQSRPGRALLWAAVCWLAASAVLGWLIRQPGTPYNVRELFLGDGHPAAIALFAMTLLWLGAGPRLALDQAMRRRASAILLPVFLCTTGIVTLLMLAGSVTPESLDDIAGSNNRYWWVTERGIWGPHWAALFRDVLGAGLVASVERAVRFLALYLPPAALLALALAAFGLRLPPRRLAALALPLLPLLWLSRKIAFDWSSTDNLNELIAPVDALGLRGGVYLYALLALLCLHAALLADARRRFWLAALFTLAALPLSWWLLNQGLAAEVHKYGLVYSGTQFLLGADRQTLPGEGVLLLRWLVLYLPGVALLAIGAALARRPAS